MVDTVSRRAYNAIVDTASTCDVEKQLRETSCIVQKSIWTVAEVTDKQKDAMTEAGVDYKYQSIYEITYDCLVKLLSNGSRAGK